MPKKTLKRKKGSKGEKSKLSAPRRVASSVGVNVDRAQRRVVSSITVNVDRSFSTVVPSSTATEITLPSVLAGEASEPSFNIEDKSGVRPPGPRAAAVRWIRENPREIRKYAGRWIAVDNKSIVGTGKTAIEALYEAEKLGAHAPVVLYVEKE